MELVEYGIGKQIRSQAFQPSPVTSRRIREVEELFRVTR